MVAQGGVRDVEVANIMVALRSGVAGELILAARERWGRIRVRGAAAFKKFRLSASSGASLSLEGGCGVNLPRNHLLTGNGRKGSLIE